MPKLLLADDSITIQRVIELTFSREDVQVVAVGDGDEAIARIAAEPPDIVLADIGMPKRTGYDVSAYVKNDPALAHIPVLLLAGAFEPVDQARADQVRCDGVLVKPFEPQQVIARVRELVNGARMLRQAVPGPAPAEPAGRSPDAGATPPGAGAVPAPTLDVPDPRAGTSRVGEAADSLDEYFDRLDAAFATLGTAASPATPPEAPADVTEPIAVPTIDDLLAGGPLPPVPGGVASPAGGILHPPVEPPESSPTLTPSTSWAAPPEGGQRAAAGAPEGPASGSRNVIADVFSALLAVEQGDPAAARQLPTPGPIGITDDLVDEVTQRVIERLAPETARALVAEIVSEVAERLVREEIARIREKA